MAASEFLAAWDNCRWDRIASMAAPSAGGPAMSPKRIKGDYATEELTSYQIDTLAEQSAAVCLVHVTLTINDEVFHPALRWVYQNEGGQVQVPGLDEGSWRLMCWGAPWMKRDVAADDAEPSA